jgi:hypothetical protein
MPQQPNRPMLTAREIVDLEAQTRAMVQAIRRLPQGKARSQALAEATMLQARALTLFKIATSGSHTLFER